MESVAPWPASSWRVECEAGHRPDALSQKAVVVLDDSPSCLQGEDLDKLRVGPDARMGTWVHCKRRERRLAPPPGAAPHGAQVPELTVPSRYRDDFRHVGSEVSPDPSAVLSHSGHSQSQAPARQHSNGPVCKPAKVRRFFSPENPSLFINRCNSVARAVVQVSKPVLNTRTHCSRPRSTAQGVAISSDYKGPALLPAHDQATTACGVGDIREGEEARTVTKSPVPCRCF